MSLPPLNRSLFLIRRTQATECRLAKSGCALKPDGILALPLTSSVAWARWTGPLAISIFHKVQINSICLIKLFSVSKGIVHIMCLSIHSVWPGRQ